MRLAEIVGDLLAAVTVDDGVQFVEHVDQLVEVFGPIVCELVELLRPAAQATCI